MSVKSAKQFRLMEAAYHGKLNIAGPSAKVAQDFLGKTSHEAKSAFASEKRKKKFTSALRKRKV